jgi:hypothetical protein
MSRFTSDMLSDIKFEIYPVNSTSGSSNSSYRLSHNQVTEKARLIIPELSNKVIIDTLTEILNIIDSVTLSDPLVARYIKPISPTITDDGSLLLEWNNPDFRLGFNIEDDKHESGWYLVTSSRLQNIRATDRLINTDLEKMVKTLIKVVEQNS